MNIKEIIDKEKWNKTVIDNCRLTPFDWRHLHNLSLDKINKKVSARIAELEAQLPKVVTPRPSGDGSYYACDCDEDGVGGLYRTDAYCYKCGAKLNWEEA